MSRDWLDKDFYATLGVTKEASSEEIKKAEKDLLLREISVQIKKDKDKILEAISKGNVKEAERLKIFWQSQWTVFKTDFEMWKTKSIGQTVEMKSYGT